MSNLEIKTLEQKRERARMAEIRSDADVLAACFRYFEWLERGRLTEGLMESALSQKILFLQNALQQGISLQDALWPRIDANINRLATSTFGARPELAAAVDYVVTCIRTDMRLLDYDPKFHFMAEFVEQAYGIFQNKIATEVTANYNTLLIGAVSPKIFYAKMVSGSPFKYADGRPQELDERSIRDAKIPFSVQICSGDYSLVSSINNRDGLHAWEEGAEIAYGLASYIHDPKSHGQLCSMRPPEWNVAVDWQRNAWVSDPRYDNWYSWSDPKELLNDFEMMDAEPSVVLKS